MMTKNAISVIDPSIVHLTDDAADHIKGWFDTVASDPKLSDHLPSLTHVHRAAHYDAAGNLQSTLGPHLGLGCYKRSNVDERYLVEFLGHEVFLYLHPEGEAETLRSVDIELTDRVLEARFDPPALAPTTKASDFPAILEQLENDARNQKKETP